MSLTLPFQPFHIWHFPLQDSMTFHFARSVEDVLSFAFGTSAFPFVIDTDKITEINSKL